MLKGKLDLTTSVQGSFDLKQELEANMALRHFLTATFGRGYSIGFIPTFAFRSNLDARSELIFEGDGYIAFATKLAVDGDIVLDINGDYATASEIVSSGSILVGAISEDFSSTSTMTIDPEAGDILFDAGDAGIDFATQLAVDETEIIWNSYVNYGKTEDLTTGMLNGLQVADSSLILERAYREIDFTNPGTYLWSEDGEINKNDITYEFDFTVKQIQTFQSLVLGGIFGNEVTIAIINGQVRVQAYISSYPSNIRKEAYYTLQEDEDINLTLDFSSVDGWR